MSTTCLDSSLQWMMNSGGQSPCEVLESVLKVCEAGAKVPNLSVDVSCGSLGNSSSACCCSTATYALVSACWMCQTNRPPSQLSSTYQSWWSGCPVDSRLNGSLPAVVISQSPPIAVPRWALVQPPSTDASWNVSSAQLAVGITPTSTLSSSSTATSSPSPIPHPKQPNLPYAPIAVCSALLVLLFGMVAWLYRRRNRISPSRPPPDFEIDGGVSSGLIPKENPRPTSWAWWRKMGGSDRRRQSESDPGKIDAWRYPFDYEPVSTGSSGSGSGRYYDPYRPRRNSDVHPPRSSMDTLAVRGQASTGTLRQNLSRNTPTPTSNLRTTPSPVPGPTPIQTYTSLPQGYTHSQPPTYGQTLPYTYPYAQPVPSSSTSPLSPHVQSPTRRVHVQGSSLRVGDQVVMIPVDQMSSSQIEQLRHQFPDLRIKHKKRRRRHGQGHGHGHARDTETDREDGGRGRARAGTDARVRIDGPAMATATATRPRSWSVPVPAQVESGEEWDGRPRNGVELREKYERRGRERVVITVGGSGVRVEGGGVRGTRETRGARETSGEMARGPRERTRARDAGVSLMGGPHPPPPRR